MSILTPGQLQRIRKFEEGGAAGDQPYVASVTRQDQFMDPLTQQLLYGTDGQGGFIPGAFRAAERTFFDMKKVGRLSYPRRLPVFLQIKFRLSS
jgi:hypothetical protein